MRTFLSASNLSSAAILALLSAFLSAPAQAQLAVGAAGAKDWFTLGPDADQQEILSPAAQIAYDIVTNDAGTAGFTVSYRAMSSMDAGGGALVSEYGFERWGFLFGESLELFGGLKGESWAPDLVGETKFLGGARLGARFDAMGVPWEFSVHGAWGSDDVRHTGVFLGPRISAGGE